MQKILTIDHGNSSIKARLYEDRTCIGSVRSGVADIDILSELTRAGIPDGVIYAAVGHSDGRIETGLRSIYGDHVLIMTHATPLPIGLRYSTPGTLGLDRTAAAVGAWGLYHDRRLLVADAGTALTVDIVDRRDGFMGGNISAGVGMRLEALHRYTARLPLVRSRGLCPEWGLDTETAIRAGAVRGAAAEIVILAERSEAERIVLTGGDAELLEHFVNDTTDIPVSRVDDLVCQGLLRIYEYNEGI